MEKICIIAKRELNAFFNSLMAYILLVLFLGFSGFFTWLGGNNDIFFTHQTSLAPFFGVSTWTLFFFIPALTMRMLAEENKTGTIELLLTKPVSHWQVVVGKFLASLGLICIALAFTLPYYITMMNIGKIDHGAVISGYLGLILFSATFISIGLFASSITNNQIVAFLSSLSIGIFFQILFGIFAGETIGIFAEVFNFLSITTHFDSISRGIIDSKDIIYFLSIIVFALLGTESVLSRKTA